jgi:hypothetical protein
MLTNHEPDRNIEDLTDTEMYDAIRYLEQGPRSAHGENNDVAATDQNDDNGVALLGCLAFVWLYWR